MFQVLNRGHIQGVKQRPYSYIFPIISHILTLLLYFLYLPPNSYKWEVEKYKKILRAEVRAAKEFYDNKDNNDTNDNDNSNG